MFGKIVFFFYYFALAFVAATAFNLYRLHPTTLEINTRAEEK